MVTAATPSPDQPRSAFSLRRLLKLLVITLICLYLFICLALWVGQEHLIFFPSKELTLTPAHFRANYDDVTITPAKGQLTGWWLPAAETGGHEVSGKVLLYLHGNGGNLSDNAEQAVRLNHLGLPVFIIDYRG